jgi:branched-chain amino acid transport system ATP-binding protein
MMLALERVNTFYGEAHILFDISLNVRQGESLFMLGRNGVGKTTLIRTITGLTPAASGTIVFKGEEITRMPPYRIAQKGIGYVPDNRRIFPSLTVLQNLELGRKRGLREDWSLGVIYEHFPKLKELENRSGEYLSGGEQQMLAIARTLMGNPELILLDEPLEGLAPLLVKEVLRIISRIKESGMSILLVDQYSPLAIDIVDRCYVLDKGHVIYQGEARELKEDEELRRRLLFI